MKKIRDMTEEDTGRMIPLGTGVAVDEGIRGFLLTESGTDLIWELRTTA